MKVFWIAGEPSGDLQAASLVRALHQANPNIMQRILELEPSELHERVPFFIGSPEMVDMAHAFLRKYEEE